MHKARIAELQQKAAEVTAAWREHVNKGDADAAEAARLSALSINGDLTKARKAQTEHEEMLALERDLSQTNSRPKRLPEDVKLSAGAVAHVLDGIDHEVVLSALNSGVSRTAEKYALCDDQKAALQLAAQAHDKAFRCYVGAKSQRAGTAQAEAIMAGLPEHVRLAMWTVEGDKGGFLAPPTFRSQPVENRVKPGVFRKLARTEPTKGDLVIPVIKQPTTNAAYAITDFTGAWVSEGNRQSSEQVLNVEQLKIPTHEWQGYWVPITEKLMRNAGANVAEIVTRVIVAAANLAEEIAFWTGNGVDRPEGLLKVGNSITAVNSGHASQLTFNGLRTLHYTLAAPYRESGIYVMSSLTYGQHVLGLESTGGTYVFPPNTEPMGLFGKPVEFCELLDSVAANNHPIIFGDFAEGYVIAEESTLRILRSDEKFIPQIGFLPTMTIGGQKVQGAAFVKQKVAA